MNKKKKEQKKQVNEQPQTRSFSCFIGLHNWNGGKVCVNCGKRR